MTIGELKQKLDRFDDDMKVNVYSMHNHMDAKIIDVVEDGVLEKYVTLMTEDAEGIRQIRYDDLDKYHTIKINPSTYKPVTEPNIKVVQMICDAFINGDKFRPYTHQYKCYHAATKWVSEGVKNARFIDSKFNSYRIHDCDMEMAFECLQRAGYNMFAIKEYTGFVEIVCSEKPYYEKKGIFYERIDKYVEHID